MKNNYSADNIQVLKGLEAVRKRPGMYIGSVSEAGLHHLVYEVVDNSIDEALAGFCDAIEVVINDDGSLCVMDNGRGIPTDIHPAEGVSALEVVLTKLHAGGKFDKGTYKVSGGLHGRYERGSALEPVKIIGETKLRGTFVHFMPDHEIFETLNFNFDTLSARMRELAFLNKGVSISLIDRRFCEEKKKTFYFEGGLVSFVQYINQGNGASKAGFAYLIEELKNLDFWLVDCQQESAYLSSMGAITLKRMGKRVAILGSGAWGLAIAQSLAEAHQVTVWTRDSLKAIALAQTRVSPYLADIHLAHTLEFSSDLEEVLNEKDYVFIATPSRYTLDLVKRLSNLLKKVSIKPTVVVLTKGFVELNSKPELLLKAIESILPKEYKENLVYLSGPSHAEEVVKGMITGLISASFSPKKALEVRDLLNNSYLKVYPSLDPIGVQVAAAVKNAVAIAFGVLDAFKESHQFNIGDNSESFLLAVGLNEIQMLAKCMGNTHYQTISSIAGIGDLDVTCRSIHGRNRRFGRSIILENTLDKFKGIQDLMQNSHRLGYMVEGIGACYYANEIAKQANLALPLLKALYQLLDKQKTAEYILASLLTY
ncbi:UNVERIFIED_CONTAM: hypothetical protein PYX00_011908 [Menopon gallinae]|uniref:Glycerol-3-phosphate dehydrogenase [NAD(+)] n=1 Tax=Menopon gallinae TaxID=328185 RepID=A0AAW2H8U5_9NEOP